ncbi:MAG TPA: mechanosensitive ion channel domain-containing protein [Terriglobales bacterium]|nr:mechanosensitive ion channel domain-containing protein [Terriglobales bacterium]
MGKSHQKTIFAALAALLLLAIVGLILTSGGSAPTAVPNHKRSQADETPLVDQRPLQTARSLASTAATPAERELAQEAARVADHEVDLAFASALREAAQHPGAVSPQARQLDARVKKLTAKVGAEQDWVNKLGQLAAKAAETEKARLEQQQQLMAAQLELDKDELGDAQNDLMRAGGNPVGKVERMREEHEDATHAPANTPLANSVAANSASAANAAASNTGSLIDEVQAWSSVRSALTQVRQAQQAAVSAAAALAHGHEALEQETQQEQGGVSAAITPVVTDAPAVSSAAVGTAATAAAANPTGTAAGPSLATLKHLAGDQKTLAEFDQRVQDEQELADVYASWVAVLQVRERAEAHAILQSLTWILLVLLAVLVADQLIDRFVSKLGTDRKRFLDLRVVLRFAAQALGVLAVIFIVFGKPAQMPTILGLAGAGLTVALKDFIVGFFGWFVLMGRNGIRVGDWVEIEGVGGEVAEIGLLRTVLLETGNWTEAGHPTGRKVAFVNSFAIEGHYFNFSTSGQWLWDELRLEIPVDRDPYPLIQGIRDVVAKETEASFRQAKEEWQRVTRQYGVKAFSAEPAIDVQPTASGVQLVVRYIARAHERHELRARLNHAMVELLHGKRAEAIMR